MAKQFFPGKIPAKLYKYRTWDNDFHKRLLTNYELYFTNPHSFNDPFDCRIPVRWDLMTDKDCYNKNIELVKILNKHKAPDFHNKKAREITNSKQLWHPEIQKESDDSINEWNEIIGLCALSEKRDEILMWSHYSKCHTGFVVGFLANSLNKDYDFDFLDKIVYSKDYPMISGIDDIKTQFYKKFFYKSDAWNYEAEWRLTKNHITKRIIKLKEETFAEIIIGCLTSDETKKEIIRVVKSCLPNINIYQAERHPSRFQLVIKNI